MKKTTIAAALALTTIAGIFSPATASATPSGCTARTVAPHAAQAYCSAGKGGAYQVYVTCKQVVWPNNYQFIEGPWRNAGSGQISEVKCPFWLGYEVLRRDVGLRR